MSASSQSLPQSPSAASAGLYSVYEHDPPLSAPIVFTAVFAVQILAILFRCLNVRGPTWRKSVGRRWWIVAVPAAVETAGYALRIASTLNQTDVGLYISSLVIILIAPQISAIIAYAVLIAIVVNFHADGLCPVKARLIAPIWLTLDLVAGALQGGGGGQQTNPERTSRPDPCSGRHGPANTRLLGLLRCGVPYASPAFFYTGLGGSPTRHGSHLNCSCLYLRCARHSLRVPGHRIRLAACYVRAGTKQLCTPNPAGI